MVENWERLDPWAARENLLKQVGPLNYRNYEFKPLGNKVFGVDVNSLERQTAMKYIPSYMENWPDVAVEDYLKILQNEEELSNKVIKKIPEGLTEDEHEQGILHPEDQTKLRKLIIKEVNQARPELRIIEKEDNHVGTLRALELRFCIQHLSLVSNDLKLNHVLRAVAGNYDKEINIRRLAQEYLNKPSRENGFLFFKLASNEYDKNTLIRLFNEAVAESIDLVIRGRENLKIEDFLIDCAETIIPTYVGEKDYFIIRTEVYDCRNNFDWLGDSNLSILAEHKLQSATHQQASSRLTLNCYGDLQLKKNKRKLFL